MNSLQKHTYTIDELIDVINLSDDLIFEESIKKNIEENIQKIICSLVENDSVELFGKIKKIFTEFDFTKILVHIKSYLKINLHNLNFQSIEWLIKNEKDIFFESIEKMSMENFITILKSDNLIKIDELIRSDDNLKIYEKKIITYVDHYIMDCCSILDLYEKIIIILDTYLNYKVNCPNLDIINFHCHIFYYMFQINISLDIIIKYKKRYKISDTDLKKYFEKEHIFMCCIGVLSKSTDVINWFFEIVSMLNIIKSSNCKNIFDQVCQNGNLESTKLVYNLIQCAGLKIDKNSMNLIIYSLMQKERWTNTTDKFGNKMEYSEIIYELINIGIQPPKGKQIYTDYYNNITIIKK